MAQARPIPNLDCDAHALDGARRVLLGRLREMIEFREQALDFSDPEGVHAMRVASRRLRSALRDFRSLLARRDITRLGEQSKVFADKLGGVRDQDVAIMRLEELARDAPPGVAPGLAALIAERQARRDAARIALTSALTPEALAKLERSFNERLDATNSDHGDKDEQHKRNAEKTNARPNFHDYGRERIRKQFARLHKRAVSLYRPYDSEPLHELRIEAKRLRYALELFGVCWGGELSFAAEHVSDLQGALGDLHDCDVWIEDLHDRLTGHHDRSQLRSVASNDSDDQPANGKDDENLRRACLWLLDILAKERTKHYRRALATWSEWEREGFAARLVATLTSEVSKPTATQDQHSA